MSKKSRSPVSASSSSARTEAISACACCVRLIQTATADDAADHQHIRHEQGEQDGGGEDRNEWSGQPPSLRHLRSAFPGGDMKMDPMPARSIRLRGSSKPAEFFHHRRLDSTDREVTLRKLYDITLSGWRDMVEDETSLHRQWFRQLTTCGSVIAAGFTALLSGLGVWLGVKVLLVGAALVGGVFLTTLIALALGARGSAAARGPAPRRRRASRTRSSSPTCSLSLRRSSQSPAFSRSPASSRTFTAARSAAGRVEHLVVSRDRDAATPVTVRRRRPARRAGDDLGGRIAGGDDPDVAASPAVQRAQPARARSGGRRPFRDRTDPARARTSQPAPRDRVVGGWHRHLGTWTSTTGTASLDDRCRSMLGLPADAKVDYGGFLGLMATDDRERVGTGFHQAARGDDRSRHDLEFRVLDVSARAPSAGSASRRSLSSKAVRPFG